MKISVIIVTKDRLEDLHVTINGFLKQNYADKEIIVIDNGSTDGTRETIPAMYPEVIYFFVRDNFDIRANNIGLELASGDIIWKTDSDAHPESPEAFNRVAGIFLDHPDIHVISMENVDVLRNNLVWDWYGKPVDKVNIPPKGYKANTFPGTGAAIRKEVIDNIGGFWGFGYEENDFASRAIIAGYNIRYFPDIRVLHFNSPNDRPVSNRWVIVSAQLVRLNCKYFPLHICFGRFLFIYFTQLLVGLFSGVSLGALFEGIFYMPAVAIGTIRKERYKVPKDKLREIPLGEGIVKPQLKYYSFIFISKLKKLIGK